MSTIVLAVGRAACAARATAPSTSGGDSTAVGSSRIRIVAPRYSAFRISTRCASPTDRSATSAIAASRRSPVALAQRLAPPRSARARSSRSAAPWLAAEHDVLGDGERRHEHEVLVHHADAGGDRVAPCVQPVTSRPFDFDRARVGRVHAARASASASTCRRRSRRRARGSRRARPRATRRGWRRRGRSVLSMSRDDRVMACRERLRRSALIACSAP